MSSKLEHARKEDTVLSLTEGNLEGEVAVQ